LSLAAHLSSVLTSRSTFPLNTFRPLAITLTGLLKSNLSGDSSSGRNSDREVVLDAVLGLILKLDHAALLCRVCSAVSQSRPGLIECDPGT
jgi:hypothetical protein